MATRAKIAQISMSVILVRTLVRMEDFVWMNLVHFHATVLKISWVTVVKSYEVRFVFKQILLVTYVKEVEIFPRAVKMEGWF